eukprot:1374099-Pyramimonas_sp.AAC.1
MLCRASLACRAPRHHCHRESASGRTRASLRRLLGSRASQVLGRFSLSRGHIGQPLARPWAEIVAAG